MEELKDELTRKLANILEKASTPHKKSLLAELEKKTYDATFWQDSKAAGDTLKKITLLKNLEEWHFLCTISTNHSGLF